MQFQNPLFVLPEKVEARWINPENIKGAKGAGGGANAGRKGAACYGAIKAGAQIELANTKMYFKSWWGEGETKIYIDGDRQFPTLCGRGHQRLRLV